MFWKVHEALETKGFSVVPNVLCPAECDRLVAAIETFGIARNAGLRQPHLALPEIAEAVKAAAIRDLLPKDALLVRSILFDKTSGRNWMVPWHQDLAICVRERKEVEGFGSWSMKDGFVHVHAPAAVLEKMIAVRLHLDECGPGNGPLRVIPGSHRNGRLSDTEIESRKARNEEEVCIVPRGGALLMKPLLLHASSRASEAGHRRVLHLEFSAEPLPGGLEWLAVG